MISLKFAVPLVLLALVAALWLRGNHFADQARSSKQLLSSALAIGNANGILAQEQSKLARTVDAVATLDALRKRDIRRLADAHRKEIHDAPQEDDGPLAPVLRRQLDRLPERTAPNSGRDSSSASGSVLSSDHD